MYQGSGRTEPKWALERYSHWQMMTSDTKHQSSVQRKDKHCGVLLTTDQLAKRCQQSDVMEWFSNKQIILDNSGSTHERGAQCCWLWARPHNVTDKSAQAGQSVERGNESDTGNHQGHTPWHIAVHARSPTGANQTDRKWNRSKHTSLL